ncbi:MAG: hypothetical protein KA712_04850 [Myxococcales bacterium]|nr:hypothetical protein [Myxococcales bacterium]
MKRVALLLAVVVLGACADDESPANINVDGGSDAAGDALGAAPSSSLLPRPSPLLRPPQARLPAELLPPGR